MQVIGKYSGKRLLCAAIKDEKTKKRRNEIAFVQCRNKARLFFSREKHNREEWYNRYEEQRARRFVDDLNGQKKKRDLYAIYRFIDKSHKSHSWM